ncbi:MAG TPA: DUF420 domain-containing protein [Balneolales bacterium]|nr:DUF420 domain-containing protein [Balneolales bacterium]
MSFYTFLPPFEALLNTTTAVLLLIGLVLILKKRKDLHLKVMWTAFVLSVLFLASYLTLHFGVGEVHFLGTGIIRPIYYSILISHIILATAIVPLVLITLYRATKGNYANHRKIARWTWPLWFYVSITGVIIYLMLAASGSYQAAGI